MEATSLVHKCANRSRRHWYVVASRGLPAALVVVIGAVLRLYRIDLIRHTYDYAYPSYDALRILELGQRPLLGQFSSIFTDNPPLMSYLQAGVLRLHPSLYAVYLLIIALNVLSVWLVYSTGRRLFGPAVGLVAALLFAVNPWMIQFSRAAWVQGLMPFFTALVAWGLWPGMISPKDSKSRVLVGLLGLVAMTQTYIQAWGALLQVGPLLALFGRRLPRIAVRVGLLVLALGLLLYAAGVAQAWERNREQLAGFASESRLQLNGTALDHAVRLVTGRDFDYVYTRDATGYPWRRAASLGAHYLLAAALLTGVGRAVASLRRPGGQRRVAIILLVWFLIPTLLMSVSSNPIHPHYLLLSCPAGHLLAAWGIEGLWSRAWSRRSAMAVLAAIALLFGLNQYQATRQVSARPSGAQFEGWSLGAGTQVGQAISELVGDGSRPVRVAVDADPVLASSLSCTSVESLRSFSYPQYVILPGNQPLLYVLVNQEPAEGVLGPHETTFPERAIALADGTEVAFLRVGPYTREAALALPEVVLDWPSESGLTLLGYTIEGPARPGQALALATYWRVDDLPAGHWEWFVGAYYHVWDWQERRWANVSGRGQWTYNWRVGDVHVERAGILLPADIPPGEYRLDVGLFDTIHAQQYPVRSPDGMVAAARIPITVHAPD